MIWLTQMSWGRTAHDLTDEDLFQQIESMSNLMDVLVGETEIARSDPLPYAWKGYRDALLVAGMLTCMELSFSRRCEDKLFWKFSRCADRLTANKQFYHRHVPWFRDRDVIRSHRSTLLARSPGDYEGMWPGTPENMPLLWPVIGLDPAVFELRVAKADLPRIASGELVIPATMTDRIVNL